MKSTASFANPSKESTFLVETYDACTRFILLLQPRRTCMMDGNTVVRRSDSDPCTIQYSKP